MTICDVVTIVVVTIVVIVFVLAIIGSIRGAMYGDRTPGPKIKDYM